MNQAEHLMTGYARKLIRALARSAEKRVSETVLKN